MPTMHRFTFGVYAAIVSVCPLLSANYTKAEENTLSMERKFALSGRPSLMIRNSLGQTRITVGDKGQVMVRAVKEARPVSGDKEVAQAVASVDVRIERHGNRVEVEANYPKTTDASLVSEPQVVVNIEIVAPKSSDIDARNADGALDVTGFDGNLDLGTTEGDLTLTYCSGRMKARSQEGNLKLNDLRGEVIAETAGGNVDVDGIIQVLDLKSGNAPTDIIIKPGSMMEKDWSIRSGDGDVLLSLPPGFSAMLDAAADSGRVETDLPITMGIGTSDQQLVGKLNKGRYTLRIRTAAGNIRLH